MPGQPLPAGPRLLMLKSAMMSGDDVRAVQQALNKHDSAGLHPDGIYGPAIRDAALSWQRREHIAVDGIIGPQTSASLDLPTLMARRDGGPGTPWPAVPPELDLAGSLARPRS